LLRFPGLPGSARDAKRTGGSSSQNRSNSASNVFFEAPIAATMLHKRGRAAANLADDEIAAMITMMARTNGRRSRCFS
jgi:hypothetical protein